MKVKVKVKSYKGKTLYEDSYIKLYFNKYNFAFGIMIDRRVIGILFSWFILFIKR